MGNNYFFYMFASVNGEMGEWLKPTVSKIVVPFVGTEGSNPSLSAKKQRKLY